MPLAEHSPYVSTRPTSRKGKNLAQSAECTVTVSTESVDLVVDCTATEVTDEAHLRRAADAFFAQHEWRLTVRDGHAYKKDLPQSPTYGVYKLVPDLAFGFGADGLTATRWRFPRPTRSPRDTSKGRTMRRVIVSMWTTLDGFVAGPTDEMDRLAVDDQMLAYEIDVVTNAETLLLGRVTHGDFAGSWPEVAKDTGADENQRTYAQRVDAMEKVVASKSGNTAEWKGTQRLTDLDLDTITELKRQPGGDIVTYGSLSVVNALTRLAMIDEYHLLIHPLYLCSGKPLFHGEQRMGLELVSAETFQSGVMLTKYLPARESA